MTFTRIAGLSSWAYKVCFSYYTESIACLNISQIGLGDSQRTFHITWGIQCSSYIHIYIYIFIHRSIIRTSWIECWIHHSSSILWSSLCTAQQEILISFNSVSLYTTFPIRKALYLLSQSYDEDWPLLDLSLFPMVVNIIIKDWEDGSWLGDPPLLVYVHDTIIWLHGPDKLMAFLNHLNSIHKNILHTDIHQKSYISLDCKVYQKFNHTNLELNFPTTTHQKNW